MIVVIGLGFVGLTTALGLCQKGMEVIGIDSNEDIVQKLNDKSVPFHEPYLNEVLGQQLNKSFHVYSTLQAQYIDKVDIAFICVGTPIGRNGKADLSYVTQAAIDFAKWQSRSKNIKTIVVKSSIPPGSTENVVSAHLNQNGYIVGKDILLANNPEFLREGFAWQDFLNPDRIVIGVEDSTSAQRLKEIYKNFDAPIHQMNLNTSEFIKYLSNSFLATAISFANEMSMIAMQAGSVNIKDAFDIFHQDKRWFGEPGAMSSYVYPGCGFGGYCLPKDIEALNFTANEQGLDSDLLRAVIDVNKKIAHFLVSQITNTRSPNARIGILGLAFKPESDDVRQSPSAELIQLFLVRGFSNISVYDPIALDNFRNNYSFPIAYFDTLESILCEIDVVVIATAWQEFKDKKALYIDKEVYDLRYYID